MRLILISDICANVFMITSLYCSGLMAVRHCSRKASFFSRDEAYDAMFPCRGFYQEYLLAISLVKRLFIYNISL
jgi:hypothetical protein